MRKLVLLCAFVAVPLFADSPKISMLSNPTTTAHTAGPVTSQTDNLRLEATVKWLGPSNPGSLIVYNGNGCCSGWGILVFSSNDTPANAVAVLAGGVTIVPSTITLTPNKWQHVTMDRVNQNVTLTVTDVGDDGRNSTQTADLGIVPVNFVGFLRPAVTYVGDAFNGFIADAKITDLGSSNVIDSWDFTHGSGTSGKLTLFAVAAASGSNGNVLNLTSPIAAQVPGNN